MGAGTAVTAFAINLSLYLGFFFVYGVAVFDPEIDPTEDAETSFDCGILDFICNGLLSLFGDFGDMISGLIQFSTFGCATCEPPLESATRAIVFFIATFLNIVLLVSLGRGGGG